MTGVLTGALATATSRAMPTDAVERARQLFVEAEADEDAERWSEAAGKLHAVAQVKPTAGVRYHIALCEEHLGRLVRALGDYSAAEDQARLENARDVLSLVGRQLATLESRIPHLTIRVGSAFPNASIKVDGEPVDDASIGVARPVDPGEHRVESSAPGRLVSTTVVTLLEYESRALDVSPGEPVPSDTTTPISVPGPPSSGGDSTPRSPSHPQSRGLAIGMTGLSIALAGVGAIAFFVAGVELDHAKTTCALLTSDRANACDGLKNPVRAWDWAAASAWAGAYAAGMVAVVLWTKPSTEKTKAGAHFVVGPATLGVRGQF